MHTNTSDIVRTISFYEYFEFEEKSEIRHEFIRLVAVEGFGDGKALHRNKSIDDQLIPVPGTTRFHNIIFYE